MKKFIAVAALSFVFASFADLYKRSLDQYQAKDYAGLIATLRTMDAMRPNHPTILINTAGAYALNGQTSEALAMLERVVRMNVHFNVGDHDFDSLRGDPRFIELTKQLAELKTRRVAGAEIAVRIPRRGLITEGLAYDGKTKSWFVSSARKGVVLRIDRRGVAHEFASGPHGLSGMGIDARRRLLWACSTAFPRVESYKKDDPSDPSVIAFDLATGAQKQRVKLDGDAFCDDMTVGRDGTLFVSDSNGALLRLRPEATSFKVLVPRGTIRSPQGSVLSANERILYVSDYGGPIRAVDVASGDVAPLRMPADFQFMGIDGLTRHGRDLIAVQNGIEPHRILRLRLAADGFGIERAEILEMNHPLLDEPTIGKVVGDRYYFIGASQGNKFDAGAPDLSKLTDARIFSIDLGK